MGVLTFSDVEQASATIQAEVPKKVLCGIQTCQYVVGIQKDISRLFASFSKSATEIQRRSEAIVPTITSPTGEMVGFLKAWESLTKLLATMSHTSKVLSTNLETEAIAPLELTLFELQQQKVNFLKRKEKDVVNNYSPSVDTDNSYTLDERNLGSDPLQIVVNPVHQSVEPHDYKNIQKLRDQLFLANEDLQSAVESRNSIIDRFGSLCKPALLLKVDERVNAAIIRKKKIETELAHYSNGGISENPSLSTATIGAPYAMIPGTYMMVDSWETKRLSQLRVSLSSAAKLLFRYQSRLTQLSVQLIYNVDAFYPEIDKLMWLGQLLHTDYSDVYLSIKKNAEQSYPPTVPYNELQSMNVSAEQSKAFNDTRFIAATPQFEQDINPVDKSEVKVDYPEGNLKISGISPPQLLQVASDKSDMISESPVSKTDKKKKNRKSSMWAGLLGVSSSPDKKKKKSIPDTTEITDTSEKRQLDDSQHSNISGGDRGEMQGDALTKRIAMLQLGNNTYPEESQHFSQQLTPLRSIESLRDTTSHIEHIDTVPEQPLIIPDYNSNELYSHHSFHSDGNTDLPHDSYTDKEAINDYNQAPSELHKDLISEQPLSDPLQPQKPLSNSKSSYLPDFFSHLSTPIEQHSGAFEAEYFIEIQRRFEEFLLALRNFDVSSHVRTAKWTDPLFYRGPDVEEAFRLLPYKLPSGVPLDASRETYFMTLEWGAPELDETQWGCIAYETLLLIYLHLANQNAAKEVCELPGRDIHSVSANQYASKSIGTKEGANISTPAERQGVSGALHKHSVHVSTDDILSDGIAEDNLQTVKKLVTLMRVKLGLPGNVNSIIVQLTLPSGSEFGRMGQWASLHPLDVRYRVARLLDAWEVADTIQPDNKAIREQETFRMWVLRQIHFVHTAISFKLWRLAKFLPEKKEIFSALNGWPNNGPWHRILNSSIPRFSDDIDLYFNGKLNTLIRLFELCFEILSALATAAQEKRWGVERSFITHQEHVYQSAEWIHRLVQIMTCIGSLDKVIRIRIADDELPVSGNRHKINRANQNRHRFNSNISSEIEPTSITDSDYESSAYPYDSTDPAIKPSNQDPKTFIIQTNQDFQDLMQQCPIPDVLSLYWAYETPVLQFVMSYLWKTVTDSSTTDALHVDGPILANGLMIASYTTQIGLDPSGSAHLLPFQIATLSVQTHCLLLARAIWGELCSHSTNPVALSARNNLNHFDSTDSFNDNNTSNRPIGAIPTYALRSILKLIDVDDFSDWFSPSSSVGKDLISPVLTIPPTTNLAPQINKKGQTLVQKKVRPLTSQNQEIALIRSDRLIAFSSPDPWDTLLRNRGGNRLNMPFNRHTLKLYPELSDSTDPDFWVVDITGLQEVKSLLAEATGHPTTYETSSIRYDSIGSTTRDKRFIVPPLTTPPYSQTVQLLKAVQPDIIEDQQLKRNKKSKRPDVLLRELGFARRKRLATVRLQLDLDALDFEALPEPVIDRPLSARGPDTTSLLASNTPQQIKFEANTDRRRLGINPGTEENKAIKSLLSESRIKAGYDTLHKAGLVLTSEHYEFFESLETIRSEPEGVSLICPSRIERIIMEVLYNRLISARFRSEIADVLCDYRFQLEPEALPILISIWDKTSRSMFWEMSDSDPIAPNLSQFNINFPLTELLRGPSQRYDLYRYFISQTITSLLNRLLIEAKIGIRKDPINNLRYLENLPDDDYQKQLALKECGDVTKLYGAALKLFVEELRGELEFYPMYWKDLLPSNQHALIVVYASRLALTTNLEELLESPYWPENDVPPFGSSVLAGIESFERLVREVKIATRLDIPTDPDLLFPFSSSLTAALTKKFEAMAQTLKRCMESETWEPAEGRFYSIAVIDLFSFIHHLFNAIADLHAPAQWVVPCFLQFLGRLSHDFVNFVLLDCSNDHILAVQATSDFIFNNLHSPVARVEGVGSFTTLTDLNKKHKKTTGGLLKSVGKLAGFGLGKKSKQTSQTHGNTQLISQQPPFTSSTHTTMGDQAGAIGYFSITPRGGTNGGNPPPPLHRDLSGLDSDANRSEISVRTQRTNKAKYLKKKKKKGYSDIDEKIPLPDNFDQLCSRFGPQLAYTYIQIKQSFEGSSLKHWLVRLHNLKFFADQLPELGVKFQTFSANIIQARDPKYNEIINSITEADGRVANKQTEDHSNVSLDIYDDVIVLEKLQSLLESTISSYQKQVNEKAQDVCRYITLRIIFCDFGEDLFEELYHPTFSRYTLDHVISAFKDTTEKFIIHAPESYQPPLRAYIVENLIKCWSLIITELGYHGTIFLPEDMDTLDEDLEALKNFCSRQGVSTNIILNSDTSEARTVNMFDYVNDFLCLIASKPQVLAQLGGHYESHVAKTSPIPPDKTTTSPRGHQLESNQFPQAPSSPIGEMDRMFGLAGIDDEEHLVKPKKKKKGWIQKLLL